MLAAGEELVVHTLPAAVMSLKRKFDAAHAAANEKREKARLRQRVHRKAEKARKAIAGVAPIPMTATADALVDAANKRAADAEARAFELEKKLKDQAAAHMAFATEMNALEAAAAAARVPDAAAVAAAMGNMALAPAAPLGEKGI